MIKACLECSDRLLGREDKKFCSDSCRNAYNNRINKDCNNLMRTINNQLRRNYRILTELQAGGIEKVDKNEMAQKGFNFKYYTGSLQTPKGNTLFMLYNKGYFCTKKGVLKLIDKEQKPTNT
jgi:hypothetical protein